MRLFLRIKKWKQSKCSTDIYSVIERHEVWIHATTWMNPETVVQSKRSQDTEVSRFYLNELPRLDGLIKTESRFMDDRGWAEERIESDC